MGKSDCRPAETAIQCRKGLMQERLDAERLDAGKAWYLKGLMLERLDFLHWSCAIDKRNHLFGFGNDPLSTALWPGSRF